MRKVLLGGLIGAIMMFPMGALAWNHRQEAKPIVGFDCSPTYYYTADDQYYADKNGKKLPDSATPIINPNSNNDRCSGTVYTFDDGGNKCYVAKATGTAISCIKE